ncbi:MAG: 16S rRNA (cytosine(1402)-N(4))-methyltransferase RsmH [bacterium]|nr:16S rRNA (cytosine(1402)-N(4))-methyltransferase RsmH [bacterium]
MGAPLGPDSGFVHRPVMLAEVLECLSQAPAGIILDATLGGAGHAQALLRARADIAVVGLDQDENAVAAARALLGKTMGARATVAKARFGEASNALDALGVGELAGCLFDLGVSSPQLDTPARGFSYRQDGPLDMRMDSSQELSADRIVNGWPVEELTRIIRAYGDERFAKRIAEAIFACRPIEGTAELAEVVRAAIPAATRRTGGHPAKRTFQAIRIAVNEELVQIQPGLEQAIARLVPDGRGVVISYHSGEDRIVKTTLRQLAGLNDPARFQGLPQGVGQAAPAIELLEKRGRTPTEAEVRANPRSSSARLRAFKKLPQPELAGVV